MSTDNTRADSAHLTELASRLSPDASPISRLLLDVAELLDLGANATKLRRSELIAGINLCTRAYLDIEQIAQRTESQDINDPRTLCGRLVENVADVFTRLVIQLDSNALSDFNEIVAVNPN